MCVKKSSKGCSLSKKIFSQRRRSKRGKKGSCEEKEGKILKEIEKRREEGKKKTSVGPSVSQPIRIKGPPSFMICSRATSLCTWTALVEIRCCGPSSCNRGEGGGSERVRERGCCLPLSARRQAATSRSTTRNKLTCQRKDEVSGGGRCRLASPSCRKPEIEFC